ncbi:MAG: DUF2281 domain-containing protein [Myxacorys chilensis ATA2-1-KO14]|jgi:hypothetical protein|nr:DUF2281 domain-containing protein [Myxacorys chilensis ATA2-1-KO14]
MISEAAILETLKKLSNAAKLEVLHYAEFLVAKELENSVENAEKKRQAGALKGTFVLPLPDDFDEPLDDFKEYME